ncbi:ATP-binding protein [Actinoplanes missouriensis]|uniref:ATP-binding protein n=1 Tax=Actinoplanes missouriensis TaxID=1866 RepID=UPI0033F2665F
MTSSVQAPVGRSLGERLRQARARAFVGRQGEVAAFGAALRGEADAALVFYIHGPGGIGKSTLVRRLADEARHEGRLLVELDGRFVSRSPADFEKSAQTLLEQPGSVLIVDSFEHCQWLQTWLWQQFLPRIADGALVILAGREAPAAEWTADPGWAGALHVAELGPLDEVEARRLLAVNGLSSASEEAVLRFAGGNPLALSLAAAVDAARPGAAREWSPSGETLRTLIAGLIGEVPSPEHRRALEVVAQAYTTTEELLQAALPGQDSHTLFAWLRNLPFMEATPYGIYPHDAAREAVSGDLRWRAPNAFTEMRRRLMAEYLRQIREAPEDQAARVSSQLYYLFRDVKSVGEIWVWSRKGDVQDDPLRPEDADTLIRMATECEGPESAELVRYWIERQPQAFSVYRMAGDDRIIAFAARLVLPVPAAPEDLATDPVVAAAWEYCNSTAPPAEGEHIAMTRFCIYPEAYQVPSPVITLCNSRTQLEIARSRGRSFGMLVYQDAETWSRRYKGTLADAGVRPRVGDKTYGLFVNDWRQVPFEAWLNYIITATDVPVPAAPSGTTRDAFGEAVREALQHWRSPRSFAVARLLKSRLVADSTDPVSDLRAVIQRAVDALGQDPRSIKAQEALVATYLSGAPTQEAAARRAGMSFSTYRRHLRHGLDSLGDLLWEWDLHGPRERS